MKYLVLLFVGFSSFIVEVNAQDTVCYEQVDRFIVKDKKWLNINISPSYKYHMLFSLTEIEEDSIERHYFKIQ